MNPTLRRLLPAATGLLLATGTAALGQDNDDRPPSSPPESRSESRRETRGEGRSETTAAPADRECRRVASLATVGFLIARAALRREETRGGHFRADFPDRDDIHFQRHFADTLRA